VSKRTSNSAGSSPAAFAPVSRPGRSAAKNLRRTAFGIFTIASGLLVLTTAGAGGHHASQQPPPQPQPQYWDPCNPPEPTKAPKPDYCPKPELAKEKKPPEKPTEKPPPASPPPTPPVRILPPQAAPPPTPAPPRRPKPPARPRLLVSKNGPARLVAGGRARFIIRVRNAGKGTTRGVIVSDVLPRGFFVRVVERRARATGKWRRVRPRLSGTGRLVLRVGTLRARSSALVRITLGARRGVRGRRCNIAVVNARNAPRVVAQACLRMRPPPRRKAPPSVTG
jgi:uncharacterized repeat protein (TIGR01451 family)